MPAETRSRGKAPPSRVYHSSPAPTQLEFPRRRKVVRTYSRSRKSVSLLRQSTLTQIGYVEPVEPEEFSMEVTPEKRREKRRKTMGDTPNSSFHTQTITQMIPRMSYDDDDNEEARDFSDSDRENLQLDGEEEEVDEGPTTRRNTEGQLPNKALSHVTDSRATSMVPQTPVHKKRKKHIYEVPSSQPTPGTPTATTPFDTERFRIQPIRSPLADKTPNANTSLPALMATVMSANRPRNMVIEDSYSSAPGLPSSDPIQPSPHKVTRLPYIQEATSTRASMELGEASVPPKATAARVPLAEIGREIPDSDDEGFSLEPTPIKSSVTDSPLSSVPASVSTSQPRYVAPCTPKVSSGDDGREIESSDAELDLGSPTPVGGKINSHTRQSSQISRELGNVPPPFAVQGLSSSATVTTPTPASRSIQVQAPEGAEDDLPAAVQPTSQKSAPGGSQRSSRKRKSQAEATEETQDEHSHGESPVATASVSAIASATTLQPGNTPRHPVEVDLTGDTQDAEVHDEEVTSTPHTSQKGSSTDSVPRSTRSTRSRTAQIEAREETQYGDLPEEFFTGTPQPSQQPKAQTPASRNTRSRKVQLQVPEETRDEDVTQDTPTAKSQFYTQTQGLESQRVPIEVIRAMAPPGDRSDIIISIHPEPASLIANGSKDHEFRNYKIVDTVSRMWIYVTSPVCELCYMAIVGPPKQPGEIYDNRGVGNREFNAGKGSKYAYELLQVFQLNNPASLAQMKANKWVQGAPQMYTFVPPAVVGQLLGNLQRELFPEGGPQSNNLEESQEILSTPQQIEDQLRSDIIQSTQKVPTGGATDDDIVPSSQGEPSQFRRTPAAARRAPHHDDDGFARPHIPASKTPSSVRRIPTLPQQPSLPSLPPHMEPLNGGIRPSQATTASQASSPSQGGVPVSPEKSLPRPVITISSGPAFPEYLEEEEGENNSPPRYAPGQHYSLGSSQLRLPESLMVDDVRQPPDIRDSDEEDEDDDDV